MTQFLELTGSNKKLMLIGLDAVAKIGPCADSRGTMITFAAADDCDLESVMVKESYSEIKQKLQKFTNVNLMEVTT